ncbi:MAG: cytochrome C oxidase subunit II [Candidatus Lambdaproteobacteria bacterium]|nr:cytochrome C oxidase subunit II [Candidatus Lambdaproteobacteria bacterium]
MAQSDFLKGPNAVHPEDPSAVGSRNSLNRDGRDEYVEARLVVDEEVDKIINHIQAKLPPEVLQDLHVMGNIKSYLHTYFNQSYQNMINRYLTTVEDEMSKKMRDMIDKEEHRTLNRYTPKEIADLVNNIGGPEVFNTSEVEKSMVNIMGHLQGHVQRGTFEFETATVGILAQRTDVGGFVQAENSYTMVKCSFRDNYKKPDKVVDVKLAVNVLDAELISPIIAHQMSTDHLIKEVISTHIQDLVEKEVDEINQQLSVEGRPELTTPEALFEKMKAVESYTDDPDGDASKRYQFLPEAYMERMAHITGELNVESFDSMGIVEMLDRLLKDEHIRTRGWNTAVNNMTSILDTSRMGYQYVQNSKNARDVILREYEATDVNRLPDERYEIHMRHFDASQLQEEKLAYSAQISEFKREITRLWEVVEQVYQEEKQRSGLKDWNDVVANTIDRDKPSARGGWFQSAAAEEVEEAPERVWNEITFVQRKLTTLEEMNQTYDLTISEFKQRFLLIRRRMEEIFEARFPDHRVIIEQRLNFLETEFLTFMSVVNPYHVQPGLLVEIDITSIKRLRITIKGITNVLNEFLLGISKGFTDRSVDEFTRRRSTVSDVVGAFESADA